MTTGLHRYQQEGDDHFITFSCYHRLPYLNTPAARDRFLSSLEATRKTGPGRPTATTISTNPVW